ncbi:MAG: nucleotidyltransferase domain-containing protein [Methylacidiphilales bacterium]|nr:nucleotidyltransferase domain-containing protein [Candidatus Methylacidiphilales bacterium]
MCRQAPSLEAVRTAVKSACKGRPIRRVEIFGSVARGEGHACSDVDLLVDFLPEAKVGLFEMGALKEDLEEMLGCAVDLVSRRAIEKSANPYRQRAILAAPVTIYAR